jgi:hypothetical protein
MGQVLFAAAESWCAFYCTTCGIDGSTHVFEQRMRNEVDTGLSPSSMTCATQVKRRFAQMKIIAPT